MDQVRNWGRDQPMTDNADKIQDANLAGSEADQPSFSVGSAPGSTSGPAPARDQRAEQPSGGGGFVWLLAALLVIGGGGYAAWPFLAPSIEPTIKNARKMLGLGTRPTEPSLSASPMMKQPQLTPPTAARIEPAPVYAPQPQPPLSTPESNHPAQMSEPPIVEDPLDTGVSRLVNTSPPRAAETAPDIAPLVQSLTDRLDVLEARLLNATNGGAVNTEDAAPDATGHLVRTLSELKADLATLKTRVTALESAPRGQIDPSASAQALVLAVTQLGARTESDRPFGGALDAVERIGGAEPSVGAAVARLRTYAAVGAPTQASLVAGFKTMAVGVMKAHGQIKRTGWWDELVGAASSLVTVRQTDPARIDDPVERALAVADIALKDNDLKTALAALESVHGAEGDAARAWRDAARARVEVRDAMEILHNYALGTLAATGGA